MRRLTLFLGAAAVLAAGVALAARPLQVAGVSGGAPSRFIAMGSVHDLAVEGSTVAYGMRSPDAYGVWSISGGLVKYISPQRNWDPEAVAEGTGLAVLRGGVVVWGTHGETNHSTLDISFARVAAPKVLKTLRPLQRPGRNGVLMDVQAGLVVYKAGRELRLLRLSDGRETRVPATAADPDTLHSRFGTPGLVVSHDRVVQVIPAARLAELLDAAG